MNHDPNEPTFPDVQTLRDAAKRFADHVQGIANAIRETALTPSDIFIADRLDEHCTDLLNACNEGTQSKE